MSEYWCDRKILVTIDGPHRHSTIRVDKPFARIGSHPASDIVLDHDDVDKRSLYLHATNAGIFCFGLSSSQSDLRGWMDPNEAVAVGPFWVSAQLTDPVELAHDDAKDDVFGLTESTPQLLVCCDGKPAGKFHLKRRLSILGRNAPAKLRLHGREVSGAHCAFFVTEDQTWVIDLASAAGTIVNGQRQDVARLHHGERIQLANVELVLEEYGFSNDEFVKPRNENDTTNQDLLVDDETGTVEGDEFATAPRSSLEELEPSSTDHQLPQLIEDLDESGKATTELKKAPTVSDIEATEKTEDQPETPADSEIPTEDHPVDGEDQNETVETTVSPQTEGVSHQTEPTTDNPVAAGPRLVRQEKPSDDLAQHPHRPLSKEIDKLARDMVAEQKKSAPPPSKPKPVDPNRPADDLDRVTNRLVDIEIHKKRQRWWGATSKVLVFLVVTGICAVGLSVAYQMLPDQWKPGWGGKGEEERMKVEG